jgi:hypothetical protein
MKSWWKQLRSRVHWGSQTKASPTKRDHPEPQVTKQHKRREQDPSKSQVTKQHNRREQDQLSSIVLSSGKYRPILHKDNGRAFIKHLPPAIVIASGEANIWSLELAALKKPSDDDIKFLEAITNMIGGRDEGYFLPPVVISVEDSIVRIMQVPGGIAVQGLSPILIRLTTYWGILIAANAPFHGQLLDWYLKEMRPIERSEYNLYSLTPKNFYHISTQLFDDSFGSARMNNQSVRVTEYDIEPPEEDQPSYEEYLASRQ